MLDMETKILYTFSNTKVHKHWFISAGSHGIPDREIAHKQYCGHPYLETHAIIYLPRIIQNLFFNLLNLLLIENKIFCSSNSPLDL